ncbi:uncharacterized protein [Aristolochia californica]|uniref:uncharacterized protein n=1 Tax=Aristolochia californica TaxID=171875 RepID=UPI0035DC79F9
MATHAKGPTTVPWYFKLNFPTYDGSKDPLLWFTKFEKFFYHQQMVDVDKLTLAAYHLLDEALMWLHHYRNVHSTQDWLHFKHACQMRFGHPASSDPVGELINYKQTGTLELYQKTFQERLARASEFFHPHLHVQIFNGSLTEVVQLEVELLAPTDLDSTMNYARAVEQEQRVLRESLGRKPFWTNRLQGTALGPHFGSYGPNRANQSTRHNCKRLFSIELWEEGPEELPETDIVEEEQQDPDLFLHAMHGLRSSNTMQVKDKLHHLLLLALVDSGSTHNFISEPVTKQLRLEIQQQKGLSVSVANGAKIVSVGLCANTPFTIEGHSFKADLLDIPLAGFDLVLGVKWLQLLGPILWDFQARTMTFTAQQGQITLQGIMAQVPSTLHTLQIQSTGDFKLAPLLTAFADLFNDHTGLPPVRHCDHCIRLKLGTDPVVVRPYRYPHIKKDEIERQCLNMLAQGVIQPSRSPFSSLVLLLDLKSGYHQIRVHPAYVEKTAFRMHHSHFEFPVVLFGLSNAPPPSRPS